MAAQPAMIWTTVKSSNGVLLAKGMGPYISRASTIVATRPLAMSMRITKTPAFHPRTRKTFVPPALPLPCWRMSMPRTRRATIMAVGNDPMR